MRPGMQTYAHFAHVAAFGCLGALFGFAYPKRTILVCVIVFGAAALLEIMQTMTPDRHGTWNDVLEKMAGGGIGVLLARSILKFPERRKISRD